MNKNVAILYDCRMKYLEIVCNFLHLNYRYSRYEKNRSATLTSLDGTNAEKEPALIDLGDESDFRKNDVVDLINDIRVLGKNN